MRQLMAIFNMVDGTVLLFYGTLGFLMSGMYSLLVVCVFAAFDIVAGVRLWNNQHSGYVMTIIARALQCVSFPYVPLIMSYMFLLGLGAFIPLAPLFPHVISSKDVMLNIPAIILLLITILLYIRYRRKIKSEEVRGK